MKKVISFLFIFLSAFSLRAAVLPVRFVVNEWAKNSGSGAYLIEQDVLFPTAGEPLVLRETWWIENENSMRLQVTGTRDQKEQVKLQYIYTGSTRYGLLSSGKVQKKIGDDFIEKYFHFRSQERLLNQLVQLKVLPSGVLSKRLIRNIKEAEPRPEANIHLGRIGGTTSFVFGAPSPVEGGASPGFWVEQDTYYLKKLRLPSQVEVIAQNHILASKGMAFPKQRTVRWNSSTVNIQTFNVASKSGLKSDFFSPQALETVNRFDGIDNPALKSIVEEFYLRFR